MLTLFFGLILLTGCQSADSESVSLENLIGLQPGTRSQITQLQVQLDKNPKDTRVALALTEGYIQASRETADGRFTKGVEAVTAHYRDQDPTGFLMIDGIMALRKHEFTKAKAIGEKLTSLPEPKAAYYGLLFDAQMELGQYEAAEASIKNMIALDSDYQSLLRLAYLQEINDQAEEAIRSMEEALSQPGLPEEHFLWGMTQLIRVTYLVAPDYATNYLQGLKRKYPNWAPALAEEARQLLAEKDFEGALTQAVAAFERRPLPEYSTIIGEIYAAQDNPGQAEKYYTLTETLLDYEESLGSRIAEERWVFQVTHDRYEGSLAQAEALAAARPTKLHLKTLEELKALE